MPCSPAGIEDFDFSFYNATRYSGLETHIANSYTNALLQALHYTLPFRQIAKSHLSQPCPREHCLFCEAGFLFRMLEDAQGVNCQASNFSRAFGGTQQGPFCRSLVDLKKSTALTFKLPLPPSATALGLFDAEDDSQPPRPYAPLIQNFTRFALDHMATESWAGGGPNAQQQQQQQQRQPWLVPAPATRDPKGPAPSVVSQILGFEFKQTTVCLVCGMKSARPILQHTLDLAYPRQVRLTGCSDRFRKRLAVAHTGLTHLLRAPPMSLRRRATSARSFSRQLCATRRQKPSAMPASSSRRFELAACSLRASTFPRSSH